MSPLTPPPMTDAAQNPIKKPEALRLADAIEDWNMGDWSEREVAATLRAQHALLERAREALIYHTQQTRPIVATQVAIHALTAHLEPKP